jgi:hypothetical protein
MTKNTLKIPCKCGHARINHVPKVLKNVGMYCAVIECDCADYKPDNLKYLENEYNKRNS